jgi:hypothetical protein
MLGVVCILQADADVRIAATYAPIAVPRGADGCVSGCFAVVVEKRARCERCGCCEEDECCSAACYSSC